MDKDFAEELKRELLDIRGRLNEALRTIQENCGEDEFKVYQRAFGYVMGELFLGVLQRIYADHPSLTPPELENLGAAGDETTPQANLDS